MIFTSDNFHFQLICAGEAPDLEENKNEIPNLFGGYFTVCVLITFILMVPIKIVCRQITSSEDGGSSISIRIPAPKGAEYLVFVSSRFLKTREKYISFAQFVYFLSDVYLLFNF